MVSAVGDSDLSPSSGQQPVPARPGLVVAAPPRQQRPSPLAEYLPFIITLLAGGIVVAIVALALGGPSRSRSVTVPLPPPSLSATPAPGVGPAGGRRGAGR